MLKFSIYRVDHKARNPQIQFSVMDVCERVFECFCYFRAKLQPGETVFIHGASGGVSHKTFIKAYVISRPFLISVGIEIKLGAHGHSTTEYVSRRPFSSDLECISLHGCFLGYVRFVCSMPLASNMLYGLANASFVYSYSI